MSELYDAHEKSMKSWIILSQEIRKNSDSIKQLKDNTGGLEECLTVNQELVEDNLTH